MQGNEFLSAASQILLPQVQAETAGGTPNNLQLEGIPEGFLLRNCILAEQLKTAYLCGDWNSTRQAARTIIQSSRHETLQTAAAWQILAVLSWDGGDYRKAIEQSQMGADFLLKNHVWNLELSAKHRQILSQIHSIHQNITDTRCLLPQKNDTKLQGTKETGKINIRCMGGFLVFLPGCSGQELK